jgi:hypothetical protein
LAGAFRYEISAGLRAVQEEAGVPYEFRDAHQLLADFFKEVDLVLTEIRGS